MRDVLGGLFALFEFLLQLPSGDAELDGTLEVLFGKVLVPLFQVEIGTGEEIDPNQIVDHRADAVEEFNEAFVETGELESLW